MVFDFIFRLSIWSNSTIWSSFSEISVLTILFLVEEELSCFLSLSMRNNRLRLNYLPISSLRYAYSWSYCRPLRSVCPSMIDWLTISWKFDLDFCLRIGSGRLPWRGKGRFLQISIFLLIRMFLFEADAFFYPFYRLFEEVIHSFSAVFRSLN